MNCPHCNQPVPENHPASYCSSCGWGLAPDTAKLPNALPPVKIKWLWFWMALMAPPFLTLLSALVVKQTMPAHASNESISPLVALVSAALGGTACGIILGLRQGRTISSRIVISLVWAAVLFIVCLIVCCVGCGFGGYQMRLN